MASWLKVSLEYEENEWSIVFLVEVWLYLLNTISCLIGLFLYVVVILVYCLIGLFSCLFFILVSLVYSLDGFNLAHPFSG